MFDKIVVGVFVAVLVVGGLIISFMTAASVFIFFALMFGSLYAIGYIREIFFYLKDRLTWKKK